MTAEDPIFGLIATLRRARAVIVAKEDHIAGLCFLDHGFGC